MPGRRLRVFVSYAHDSVEHKENVLSLTQLLREHDIEVHLDQEFEGRQDWSLWAQQQIEDADFVVAVASPAYKLRAEGRAAGDEGRGSQAEAAILRDKLTEDRATWTRKILPVVLPGITVADIPGFLQPYAATHYIIVELTRAGVAELLAAMSVRPRRVEPPRERAGSWQGPPVPGQQNAFVTGNASSQQAGRDINYTTTNNFPVPIAVFLVVVVLLVTTLLVWSPWLSGADDVENGWREVRRQREVKLVPESFACTSGVEDKIDLDSGQRGHGAQPQIPHSSCVSEGGLADLVIDEGKIHTASKNQDAILPVTDGKRNLDGADCDAMITSPEAKLTDTVFLDDFRVGDQLCVRTDEGRVALVTFVQISSGSEVLIDFVVWEKP